MFGIKTKIFEIINRLYDKNRASFDEDKFESVLGNISFKCLSGVDICKVNKILRVHGKQDLMSSIYGVRNAIIYNYYSASNYMISSKENDVCVCVLPTYDFGRKEMISRYEKSFQFLDNKVCIYGNKKQLRFSFERLFLCVAWFRQMPVVGGLDIKLRIVAAMLEAWQILQLYTVFCSRYTIRINRCMVLCDFQPVDTIIVQFFNSLGIETISLQHGLYGSGCGIIENSVAKRILVYGQQAFEELIKAGVSKDRIVIAGMPQLIGKGEKQSIFNQTIKKIGIVFSGGAGYLPDIDLLKIVKCVCEDKGWELYLKIRSGVSKDAYKKIIDKCSFKGVYSDDIESIDFIDNMDAIISGISTVTIESIVRMKPTFVFSQKIGESYKALEEFYFSDQEGLLSLIDFFERDFEHFQKVLKEKKEYYCISNIDTNYKNFFMNLT